MRECTCTTRGVLLPLTFFALLLALSLSSDVDIHGDQANTKLSILTLGPTDLSYFPLTAAGQVQLPGILLRLCVVSLTCVRSCALSLSPSLAL